MADDTGAQPSGDLDRDGRPMLGRSRRARSRRRRGHGGGVGGVELDERATLGGAVLGELRVARVEEPRVVLRRQQLQRVTRASSSVAAGALAGRHEGRHPRLAHPFELVGGELDAAGCGLELAVAERPTVVGIRNTYPSDAAQLVEIDGRQRVAQQSRRRRRTGSVRCTPWRRRDGGTTRCSSTTRRAARWPRRSSPPTGGPTAAPRRRSRSAWWRAGRCRRSGRCR